MSNIVIFELEDGDYYLLQRVAAAAGKPIDVWVLDAARRQEARSTLPMNTTEPTDANGWPLGFFEQTFGSLANDPIDRLPQGELEVREEIR